MNKSDTIIRWVVCLLSSFLIFGCSRSEQDEANQVIQPNTTVNDKVQSMIGQIIDSSDLSLHLQKNSSNTFISIASPAIVIEQPSDGWMRLLLANGGIAYTRQTKTLGLSLIETRQTPTDAASHPRTQSENEKFQWYNIPVAKRGKLLATSQQVYEETPFYVTQDGRMLALPEEQHPYIWPELQVRFSKKDVWLRFRDIYLTSDSIIKAKAQGIVLAQFIPLIAPDEPMVLTIKSIIVDKNLARASVPEIKLDNIQWTLEMFLIPKAETNNNLKKIKFYSSNKNCYMFSLQWNNDEVQYIAYAGKQKNGLFQAIPTPVVLNFQITDIDNDGKKDWLLHVLRILPDVVRDEWIEINGAQNTKKANVVLHETKPET